MAHPSADQNRTPLRGGFPRGGLSAPHTPRGYLNSEMFVVWSFHGTGWEADDRRGNEGLPLPRGGPFLRQVTFVRSKARVGIFPGSRVNPWRR